MITRSVVNLCWFFFKWGLCLAAAAAVMAGVMLYYRVDEAVRQRIEAKIAAHYPQLTVRVRQAHLIKGEGIEIRGFSISEPGAAGPQAELFHAEEIFLTCNTDMQELVRGQPRISQVTFRRPVIRATRRPDGTLSVSRLLPLPKFSDNTPTAVIEAASIEVFDPLKNPSSTLTLRDINVRLKPSTPPAAGGLPLVEIEGYLAADQIHRVELAGTLDLPAGRCQVHGTADGMEISPELRAALPEQFARRLEVLGTLRGEAKLRFDLAYDAAQTPAVRFNVAGELFRGRIDDARLPYPLTDIRAAVHFDNSGYQIEDLTARSGQTTIALSCRGRGYDATSPMEVHAQGTRVSLTPQLVDALPEKLRECWYKFLPDGEVNATVKLAFDGRQWTPEVQVECLNVAFSYHRFPYRLERGAGSVALQNDVLDVRLIAYSAGQPVRVEGQIHHPGPNFTGGMQVSGDNIPFDERLFEAADKLFVATPPSAGAVVRSLNPRGTFNVVTRHWRDPGDAHSHLHALVVLNRCSINYSKFPYPLSNIRGTAELTDGRWTFRDMEGTNDTGLVTCRGELVPGPDDKQLLLYFTGTKVPLEEELRDALPPNMQGLWNSMQPRGGVEFQMELRYWCNARKMSIKLRAEPQRDVTSVEPVAFPYRMEKLRGVIHYQDGHAELENVQAVHGRTTLVTGGSADFQPDGSWHLQLKRLAADRLRADRDADPDLVAALPDALKRAVAELRPGGPVNLRGTIDFARSGEPNAPLRSQWDIMLDVHRGSIDSALKLDNIYGTIHLVGGCQGRQFASRGELKLDNLTYKNFQLTDVWGPLWLDNQRVLFGSWAEGEPRRAQPRRLTAKLYSGTILADAAVALGPTVQYRLRADLAHADLAQFAKENLTGRQRLNGKVMANVDMQGTSKGTHTLAGVGNIRLRDADIYELPLMVALLKILSVRPPDASAFTRSDLEFRIQGEHIVFDRVNFSGDAVSLSGQGQMNLDKQVNMTLHAMVGRDDLQLPLVRTVLGEASQQIMQIRVEGTLDKPITRSEAFPGVSQAIQQLQADLQPKEKPTLLEPLRNLLPSFSPRQ